MVSHWSSKGLNQCARSATNSESGPRGNVASIWFVSWIDKDELRIIVSFKLCFLRRRSACGAGGHNRYNQSVDRVNGDYVQTQRGSETQSGKEESVMKPIAKGERGG